MGQVTSLLARPFRNFNVESRATKVLEKRQKVAKASPYYPSTVENLSRFRDEHPEILEAVKARDSSLHERLKNIHVESTKSSVQPLISTKPLPFSREPPPETDMGALEAKTNVPGRVTLKAVLGFLEQRRTDPENFTASRIAREHGLDEQDVENVLRYFQLFNLYIPKEMHEKNKKMAKIVAQQMNSKSPFSPFIIPNKLVGKGNDGDAAPSKV